ncbi:MAG TPA: phosphotransferase [Caulobacteraceae bacterium]|nr:phosphotransferase [Caulobacteraceae bacterium]
MDKAEARRIFTPAAVEALAAFPLEPQGLELVSLSENVTFRVSDRHGGEAYVLRLHRPGYHTLEELNSERVWTRALAAAGIAVPIPLATTGGGDYVGVPVPALGQERQAGMTRWTEGELLSDLLERGADAAAADRFFEQLGAIEAAMHNQSSGWRPPPGFARHAVDRDGLMGDAPFWGPFWDHPVFSPAERALVIATRDRIRRAMDRYGRDASTYGMIHADLHPGNLLVGGDGLTVIDFDDCAFGWHLYDIAVGLIHQQRSPHFAARQDAFVRGYRTRRHLGDDALALLPMFLLVRGLAQIGWLHQRPEIDVSRTIRSSADRLLAQCAAFEVPC